MGEVKFTVAEVSDKSYYVVLDLEMCRVTESNSRYKCKMEIIQIGAVLLNQSFDIISKFDRYVKPRFGRIDCFISNLTGIKGRDVANAAELGQVLVEFIEWMPKDSVIVSWSMTDKNQLFSEMKAKGLQFDNMDDKYASWIDCQPMFGEKVNMRRRYSLEEALIVADIFTEGSPHNGLVDASNTALLFAKMNTEKNFELNPYYKKAHEEKADKPLSCSMGEMLAGMDFSAIYISA